MLYSSVPRGSVWAIRVTPRVVCDRHSASFCRILLASSRTPGLSKSKRTCSRAQPGTAPAPPAAPPLTHTPLMQSSSSAQSSSTEHWPLRTHLPSLQRPPSPHSASAAQAEHLWSLHTWPAGQSPSALHQPTIGSQAPSLHIFPGPQSLSAVHLTHFLLTHFSPAEQSLSPSQLGYFGFLAGQPAASRPTATSTPPRPNLIRVRMARTVVGVSDAGNLRDESALPGRSPRDEAEIPWSRPAKR